MNVTDEQQAIVESSARDLVVNAFAGTGKTSVSEIRPVEPSRAQEVTVDYIQGLLAAMEIIRITSTREEALERILAAGGAGRLFEVARAANRPGWQAMVRDLADIN